VGRGGKRKSKPSAEEDDPDEDSVGGDEAIEAGGKGDIDHLLQGLKAKRGGPTWDRGKMMEDVRELQERMEEAYQADVDAVQAEPPRPAVSKVGMLQEVEAILRKKQYHEVMIDMSMLSTLARWLSPLSLPGGGSATLPSLMVRSSLLKALMRFEIDETTLGPLRSSGIGKYVKLLTLHKKETAENRKVAVALVEKWSRPIFQTSDKVRAEELPVAPRALAYGDLPRERAADANLVSGALAGERITANHARVPRPMGMDFQTLPASDAAPLPSSRYGKESTKGKIRDRIHNGKKRSSTQAVTLSVEGRTLDRI